MIRFCFNQKTNQYCIGHVYPNSTTFRTPTTHATSGENCGLHTTCGFRNQTRLPPRWFGWFHKDYELSTRNQRIHSSTSTINILVCTTLLVTCPNRMTTHEITQLRCSKPPDTCWTLMFHLCWFSLSVLGARSNEYIKLYIFVWNWRKKKHHRHRTCLFIVARNTLKFQ